MTATSLPEVLSLGSSQDSARTKNLASLATTQLLIVIDGSIATVATTQKQRQPQQLHSRPVVD